MKKSFLFAACTAILLTGMVSCKKDAPAPANDPQNQLKCGRPPQCNPTPPTNTADCGVATVVDLKSSQGQTVGTVTISNDENNLKVKYTTSGNYKLDEIRLFAGNTNQVPVRYGSVNLSQFPVTRDFNNNTTTTYTLTVPLSQLGSCFSVFAEADVRSGSYGYGCYGGNSTTQAWARGTRYTSNGCGNNSSAYYVSYCKASCTSDTCLTPSAVLFSAEGTWPNADQALVIGGYTYTKSDVVTEYYAPDNDAKTALILIATLKIYGNKITVPANINTNATTVENWLASLGQLTAVSNFTAPANVKTAITSLLAWENAKTCDQ